MEYLRCGGWNSGTVPLAAPAASCCGGRKCSCYRSPIRTTHLSAEAHLALRLTPDENRSNLSTISRINYFSSEGTKVLARAIMEGESLGVDGCGGGRVAEATPGKERTRTNHFKSVH